MRPTMRLPGLAPLVALPLAAVPFAALPVAVAAAELRWIAGGLGQSCSEACAAEGGSRCAPEGDWASGGHLAAAEEAGLQCTHRFYAKDHDFAQAPFWSEGGLCWDLEAHVVPNCQGHPGGR